MLYWAEGTKGRNALIFTNSDLGMMQLFVRFLRESLQVPHKAMSLRVIAFSNNGLTQTEIEDYWLKGLGFTSESLRKGRFNQPDRNSKGVHILPYGTCHVRVSKTEVVQHVYGAIQEYAGVDVPEWLD